MTSAPTPSQRVTREDLFTFVSACFACTGQREFYSDGRGQSVSIRFLHDYVLGNYRRLYTRILACGINHYNQSEILFRLLASGRAGRPEDRAEENALITRAIERLPTQRAMRLLRRLTKERVNNRRTRAIVRRWLAREHRPDERDFRAVKYRRAFRTGAIHVHLPFAGELAALFLRGWKERRFSTPLFESFRAAHFAKEAIYDLPYTIAEGLAKKHAVPRDVFLQRIEPRLTTLERLRLQEATREALGKSVAIDPARLSPTRLASFILSLRSRSLSRRAHSFVHPPPRPRRSGRCRPTTRSSSTRAARPISRRPSSRRSRGSRISSSSSRMDSRTIRRTSPGISSSRRAAAVMLRRSSTSIPSTTI